ncbi:MAG: Acyltransferase [Pseudonocardia sp.]|nr:Acyltransferase [Pseudonocardia sp.]
MERQLSAEDRAILAMESPVVAGHTCKVIQLAGAAADADALRAALVERLAGAPELTARLGGGPGAPAWVLDDRFHIDSHVVDGTGPAELDEDGLRHAVARLFEQRLDRRRPLWRIDLLGPLAGGGSALVWRLHHAVADGTASARLAGALLWDDPGRRPAAPAAPAAGPGGENTGRWGDLGGFVWREFAHDLHRSPFDGPLSAHRAVAFASAALSPLRRAARALADATVNDVVLSITAGALRRWLVERGQPVHQMRVKVPVSLHQKGDHVANRDSFFGVRLPVDQPDPVERLRAVRTETMMRKTHHDAIIVDELTRELVRLGPGLERAGSRIQTGPRAFALNVSNVRGPGQPVSVLGVPVRSMHSLAEIRPRHGLRIAVFSYADQLNIGLCADPAIVPDLVTLAASFEADAAELIEADRS